MIFDRELLICAAEGERQHGPRARIFLAERIGALALADNAARGGLCTWRAIARRLDQLEEPSQ